jgi:hypothetical protein
VLCLAPDEVCLLYTFFSSLLVLLLLASLAVNRLRKPLVFLNRSLKLDGVL